MGIIYPIGWNRVTWSVEICGIENRPPVPPFRWSCFIFLVSDSKALKYWDYLALVSDRKAIRNWYSLKLTFFVLHYLCYLFEINILGLWHYGLWSFQAGSTKLGRFLPKNQRKLLNFENWVNGKIGHHFRKLTLKVKLWLFLTARYVDS